MRLPRAGDTPPPLPSAAMVPPLQAGEVLAAPASLRRTRERPRLSPLPKRNRPLASCVYVLSLFAYGTMCRTSLRHNKYHSSRQKSRPKIFFLRENQMTDTHFPRIRHSHSISTTSFGVQSRILHRRLSVIMVMFWPFFKESSVRLSMPPLMS